MHVLGWLRRHLQAKMLTCIVVILLVGFGVLGGWNIRMQSAVLLEQPLKGLLGVALFELAGLGSLGADLESRHLLWALSASSSDRLR